MKPDQGIQKLAFENVVFEELLADLIKEIEIRNFLITRVSHIDNSWKRGTQKFRFKYYKIIEFCNLETCAKMISMEFNMGFFMPTRFLVYQKLKSETTYVSYQKPTTIARYFDSPELLKYATRLEGEIKNVLEEIDF